jgi:putative phage-type endonuclease
MHSRLVGTPGLQAGEHVSLPSGLQQTPEWHAARLGKVTASRVADVMRVTKSGPSKDRARYMGELIAERLTGVAAARFVSKDMEWGTATEPEAVTAYEFLHNVICKPVGFVGHPKIAMSGASPDRLVGEDGLLEIKCPATHTHIETLRGAPIDGDYVMQMQWQMACTDRLWCDFVSFDPRMPIDMQLHVTRVARDATMIARLESGVVAFLGDVDAAIEDLTRRYRSEAA